MSKSLQLRASADLRATREGGEGYFLSFADLSIYGFGAAPRLERLRPKYELSPGIAATRWGNNLGVALLDADASVWNFSADRVVKLGELTTEKGSPVVGVASIPALEGSVWVARASGVVESLGHGVDLGDAAEEDLNSPIVGITATPSGEGYWLVAADGSVYTFGDACFYGSLSRAARSENVVALASAGAGDGYWLLSASGLVSCFGSARYHGSPARRHGTEAVSMLGLRDQSGYWVALSDGTVYAMGNAAYLGGMRHGAYGPRCIAIC